MDMNPVSSNSGAINDAKDSCPLITDTSTISDCHLSELSQISRDENGNSNEIKICKLERG